MSKIGRNSPCPCGSDKKYKRCHGSLDEAEAATAHRIDRVIRMASVRGEAKRKEVEKQFGLGRPPISFESHGYKIVAVGNELQWSKNWKTFPDFLMSYFKKVMGADWGNAQNAKPRNEWSPIFEWYAQTCEYQQKALKRGEPQQLTMTGAACGAMWLTYGLYLLRHNAEIQKRLLDRLRSHDPVQIFGAVQEVLVAAAMIRAGFELKLEDETDGTTTHCEFVATSKATGKKLSVEIKVCDPGRLQGKQGKSRTVKQLSHGLSKVADHPRLIWIDLNRPADASQTPEQAGKILEGEMNRIQTQAPNLKVNGGKAPPAYIVLSNWPFRHLLGEAAALRTALLTGVGIEKMGRDVPFHSLRELAEFRAEHSDVFRLGKEFSEMSIPQTLDGSLPSRAFGKPSKDNPILIGERYMVPVGDGTEKPGELLSAFVNEAAKGVMAMVRLDDGMTIMCTMPLSDEELAIYKDSPETFFGEYKPQNKVEHPVELYEWMLGVYKDTPRERLLEFLKDHKDIERFRELPREELAKVYVEGVASAAAARMGGWKKHS